MRLLACATVLMLAATTTLTAQRTATAMPLIVVDGVIVSDGCDTPPSVPVNARMNGARLGQIEGLSRNDIETVEILKGNAPTKMYGADARNGVIVVTTKKGRHYCIDVPQTPAGGDDPLSQHLFPPDLIMAHQGEIGLQESQHAAIVAELQLSQATFIQLQFKMSAESEQLEKLVQPALVNEAQVLAQIDRVLAAEREIKRAQVALLVRTKNLLTAQQQAKLASFQRGK
ncbi:MAG: Heavy-metal resistance protein [Gemmatimonadetes bacterium]|nr:Heavy-metal resistance protein [Gemmatimonadota bacterium]